MNAKSLSFPFSSALITGLTAECLPSRQETRHLLVRKAILPAGRPSGVRVAVSWWRCPGADHVLVSLRCIIELTAGGCPRAGLTFSLQLAWLTLLH